MMHGQKYIKSLSIVSVILFCFSDELITRTHMNCC